MIRLAHASDLHCCERMRLDDWRELHLTFVSQMEAAGVDIIVLAGDLFHARSTPTERNAMAEFLQHATSVAPVVIVKGNHDAAGDLDIFRYLGHDDGDVEVLTRPESVVIPTKRGHNLGIVGLPWFDKAHLVADLSAAHDSQETTNATIECARQLLTTLRAQASMFRDEGAIPVLVGHVQLGGSVVSTGQVLIGHGVELSPSDILDVGCEYAALGHIHAAQDWFDGRVAYSGSTWRQNFGETEAKGWRLVTFDDAGKFAGAQFMELPAREVILYEGQFDAEGRLIAENITPTLPGALVRFRYRIPAGALHLVDETKLVQMFAGAHEVKLEAQVITATRSRAPEIVSAAGAFEKVMAFLRAKDIEPDEATTQRIRQKLLEIEAREVSHATT